MREIVSKGIFESKCGNREKGAIWQNIAVNHFTNLIKRYKSKTRLEIKNTGLGGEELFENKQLLEDIIERFEER